LKAGDSKFTRDFDDAFASEGIQIIKTPVRAPKCERLCVPRTPATARHGRRPYSSAATITP
jgi:hypothetical protein